MFGDVAERNITREILVTKTSSSKSIKKIIRTVSLHKLQRAMGHSSLNVSLTYLRGLEIAELKEEDMPMV